MMRVLLIAIFSAAMTQAAPESVRAYTGALTIPTYEHVGRETEPPLFQNSSVAGMYPFTTFLMPFKPGPNPKTYTAIFLENEYLRLTHISEFGGRIFSVYDKLRKREMFYRNDVIKPAPYNPRDSWPQSGLELTGPHDLHMLTLYGEPFWGNQIVRHENGSISLVLGETDPVYGMKVNFSATLHPGIAAIEIGIFCYNARDGRKPQMFWVNSAINATPGTRFVYPMSRTVGHTTADVADWPLYNGIDYSLDRNNKHMLGVFGIDIYDNFQGAYQTDRDYGIFRYADRRIVQGMKLWTFGYGAESSTYERGYTDHAGPYVELQSGRHVWDGHYEWVAPHRVESWSEWWVPVSGTGGVTTLTRDVALNLNVQADSASRNSSMRITLSATRIVSGARLTVKSKSGLLLEKSVDLDPAKSVRVETKTIPADADALREMIVTVCDRTGTPLLEYRRPDENPGRKEYTPFTKPLERPRKTPEQMSAEELVSAAEYRLKELDKPGATALFTRALALDPGYSRAHLLLGITAYNDAHYQDAIAHLEKAVERDPYSDVAYYHLAMSQFALDRSAEAERNLYYIWPDSAFFSVREYHLGRLALAKRNDAEAIAHFRRALDANADDLFARLALAVALRDTGDKAAALNELAHADNLYPTGSETAAERWLLTGDEGTRAELLRRLGAQTQEAIGTVVFYRNLSRWNDAARILQLAKENQHDPWGTTPEFYYTLAYCERRAGNDAKADEALRSARKAAGNVDRFPYRLESEAPLRDAVHRNPTDSVAHFGLGCLLYFKGEHANAIGEWEAVEREEPENFSVRRALGLAYAEQGEPLEKAAAELERAMELKPEHTPTLDDLSTLYARGGRFDDQLTLLHKALARSPQNDDLTEGLLTAQLSKGRFDEAEKILESHTFSPRHRTYSLRDKYRLIRWGIGAEAYRRGNYEQALASFESALKPPVSLGVDTFESQSAPRIHYAIGCALAALGKKNEARAAFTRSIAGIEQLSGDRDSWSSENFFMVLALEKLERGAEAAQLARRFRNFAETEKDSSDMQHRAEARYLLALLCKHDGRASESKTLLVEALGARPDFVAARLELLGDTVDPVGTTN